VWLERAIRAAMARAGQAPEDIGLAMTLARGNRRLDQREAAALQRVFGNRSPPVGTLAGHAGWAEASGSLLAVVMAIQSLRHGRVPAPGHRLGSLGAPWLTDTAEGVFGSALVAGSSHQGNNAAVVLRHPDRAAA
jgi:3-oxoacyl-(acyl-carrier-protein) synthase